MSYVILAFGSNVSGKYGLPVASISKAIQTLELAGVRFVKISSVYRSRAIGASYQPAFYNVVGLCETSLHPNRLLKTLKKLELDSGRQGSLFWGPRPLDIDIIDYKSKILNWPTRLKTKNINEKVARYGASKVSILSCPHLEMHKRVFVLKPLAEISTFWRHPVFGLRIKALMTLNCSPIEVKAIEKLEIPLDL